MANDQYNDEIEPMTNTLRPDDIDPNEVSETSDLFARKSAFQKRSPLLGGRSFLVILVLLCTIPVVAVAIIWQNLPPVAEGKLEASASAVGLPSPDYYQIDYRKRPPHTGGELLVTNEGPMDWTNINISINTFYQIYDNVPIPAGETARFELDSFVSRTGARFSLQYNELKSVRIYARLPTKNRATFNYRFPTVAEGTRE